MSWLLHIPAGLIYILVLNINLLSIIHVGLEILPWTKILTWSSNGRTDVHTYASSDNPNALCPGGPRPLGHKNRSTAKCTQRRLMSACVDMSPEQSLCWVLFVVAKDPKLPHIRSAIILSVCEGGSPQSSLCALTFCEFCLNISFSVTVFRFAGVG